MIKITKQIHPNYETIALYEPQEILELIGKTDTPKKMVWAGKLVRMKSQRYKLFKRSCVCAHCGIEGTRMYLEKPERGDDQTWHFNLYALDKDGNEILMTKDHIVPKSQGGPNTLDNYQPMCAVCNGSKADKVEHRFMIAVSRKKKLRDDYVVEFVGSYESIIEAWNEGLDHLWAEHPETQTMNRPTILHAWQNLPAGTVSNNYKRRWWVPIFIGNCHDKYGVEYYGRIAENWKMNVKINSVLKPYTL